MKKFIEEFKAFALRGNVVDLAVGVIIGGAFQTIVKSLTNDLLMPFIGLFVRTDFQQLVFTLRDVEIRYGAFITAVINFFLMALIIFIMVKAINKLTSLGKKKEEIIEEITTKTCPFCCSEISIDAVRCPHCTSELN